MWIRGTAALFMLAALAGGIFLWRETGKVPGAKDSLQKRLESLGYITWTPARGESGATVYEGDAVASGVNLYCSETGTTAVFVDVNGEELASREFEIAATRFGDNRCKVVKPWGEDLAMVVEHSAVVRFNLESGAQWSLLGAYHHDLAPAGDRLYALADAGRVLEFEGDEYPIVDTHIVEVSSQGLILRTWSVADMVMQDPGLGELFGEGLDYAEDMGSAMRDYLDVFHVNTVDVLPRDVELSDGVTAHAGDLLIASRNMHSIAVVDLETARILWVWGFGELERPHHPTLLDNGNFLIFDNGFAREWSRVIELDPRKGEIVWQYGAPYGKDFFYSATRGSAQRLDNGNTLITESTAGRVFEVTPKGRIVWEFMNPETQKNPETKKEMRATIFRMTRLPQSEARALGVALDP